MRVIQVGIGGMGNAWLGAVQRSPQVEYAALVEINPEIARANRLERAPYTRRLQNPSHTRGRL